LRLVYSPPVSPNDFKREIAEAVRVYDRHVVSLEKSTDEFHHILLSLVIKAIKAYENRGPGLRHGIALDKHVTVILSQTDSPRPMCGVYFNLYSPYHKKALPKTVKQMEEANGDTEV
jgi:hypothetical protein